MPKNFTIANLDRLITINKYLFAQDDSGGNIKLLVSAYQLFAGVEMISNNYVLEQLQVKYGEAYRIIVRNEPSRQLTDNDEIVYAGKIHKIQGITTKEEGAKWYLIINTSNGNTESNSGSGITIPAKEYHYIATGGEYQFQADEIKGWTGIILLFRDGIQYKVIRSGTPVNKQSLYDQNAGTFAFDTNLIAMATGETVDAYLLS